MARPRKLSDPAGNSAQTCEPNRLWLLEWIKFQILFLPYILQAFYRKLIPPSCKSLDGKVVLVSGAGRGLGRELALQFARLGCKVACVDINQDTALDTAAEIVRDGERAKAYFTNVAKVEEIKRLKAAVTNDLGPVDILVNNASLMYSQNFHNIPEDHIRAVVDINFLSYVWMVREFLGSMKERNAGHVVTISSISAHTAVPGASMYTACKWAITGFMDSVRMEMREDGYDNIHFTTIFPTAMDNVKANLSPNCRRFCYSLETVAARVITAVRRNLVATYIPEYSYYVCMLCKLLPTQITDWGYSLYVGKLNNLSELLVKCDPIIKDTVKS